MLQLIHDNTEERTFGLLGEPRVNVLRLNLELDRRFVPRLKGSDQVSRWQEFALMRR